MMKKSLVLFLLFIFTVFYTSPNSNAQSVLDDPNRPATISIDTFGEVMVPADLIYFQVNITRFNENAREAFEEHKQLEAFLTGLLIEEGVDNDSINAEPLGIHPRRTPARMPGQEDRRGFETRQQVSIKLDDVNQFETMQLTLIENGFDNFSGRFSSSKIDEAKDEALAKAVQEAKRKADILANASGMQAGEIVSIRYGSPSVSPPGYRMEMAAMAYDASEGSLLQFEKAIPIQENVSVVFEIVH